MPSRWNRLPIYWNKPKQGISAQLWEQAAQLLEQAYGGETLTSRGNRLPIYWNKPKQGISAQLWEQAAQLLEQAYGGETLPSRRNNLNYSTYSCGDNKTYGKCQDFLTDIYTII
jgi:hypothetical protein